MRQRKVPRKQHASRERVVHVDMGEILFVRKDPNGNYGVYAHNPKTGVWNVKLTQIGHNDSLVAALSYCAGAVAKSKTKEEFAIAHVAREAMNPSQREAHVRQLQDPAVIKRHVDLYGKSHAGQYRSAKSKRQHTKEAGKLGTEFHKRPGYYADDAARHIVRLVGKDAEVHIGGGTPEGLPVSEVVGSLAREFESHGVKPKVGHETSYQGNKTLVVRGFDKEANMLAVSLGNITFYMPPGVATQILRGKEHINVPERLREIIEQLM